MTNKDYEMLKERLKDAPNRDIVLATIRKQYPCIGCYCNDGLPHSRCYSCGE